MPTAFRHNFGLEHPRTLTSIGNLAIVLRDEGKLAEARLMLRFVFPADPFVHESVCPRVRTIGPCG
jgi:hypothetical protein